MVQQTVYCVTNENDFLAVLIKNYLVCEMEILANKILPIVFYPFVFPSRLWVDEIVILQRLERGN